MSSTIRFEFDKRTGQMRLLVEQDGDASDSGHNERHDALARRVADALGTWATIEEIPPEQQHVSGGDRHEPQDGEPEEPEGDRRRGGPQTN